jgi:hypothetical protein
VTMDKDKLLKDYHYYRVAMVMWPEKRSYYEALAAKVKSKLDNNN